MTCDTVAIFTTCLTRTHTHFFLNDWVRSQEGLWAKIPNAALCFQRQNISGPVAIVLATQEWSSFLEEEKTKYERRGMPLLLNLFWKQRFQLPATTSNKCHQQSLKGSAPLCTNLFKVDPTPDFNGSSAEMKIKGAINEINDGRIFLWDPHGQNQLFSTYWLKEINGGDLIFFSPSFPVYHMITKH